MISSFEMLDGFEIFVLGQSSVVCPFQTRKFELHQKQLTQRVFDCDPPPTVQNVSEEVE